MKLNKRAWGEEERQEFDDLVAESMVAKRSDERTRRFVAGVLDAVQAHRPWAREVESHMLYQGASTVLKAEEKKRPDATIPVSFDGVILDKPRSLGVRRTSESGQTWVERTLFDYMTIEELEAKRKEFLANAKAYTDDAEVMDRLIAMCEVAGARTPSEASRTLGVPIEKWISRAA